MTISNTCTHLANERARCTSPRHVSVYRVLCPYNCHENGTRRLCSRELSVYYVLYTRRTERRMGRKRPHVQTDCCFTHVYPIYLYVYAYIACVLLHVRVHIYASVDSFTQYQCLHIGHTREYLIKNIADHPTEHFIDFSRASYQPLAPFLYFLFFQHFL